jgi:hypothetical protein
MCTELVVQQLPAASAATTAMSDTTTGCCKRDEAFPDSCLSVMPHPIHAAGGNGFQPAALCVH